MNSKAVTILILIAFAAVIFGAAALSPFIENAAEEYLPETQQTQPESQNTEKVKAPNFKVYDPSGEAVELSDYFGKPIVINFWASWCDPCKAEMPVFESEYLELGDEVQFLMVNVTTSGRETYQNAVDFIENGGYTFPVLYDIDGDAKKTYGVYSYPVSYFIGTDGYIEYVAYGSLNQERFDTGISSIYES